MSESFYVSESSPIFYNHDPLYYVYNKVTTYVQDECNGDLKIFVKLRQVLVGFKYFFTGLSVFVIQIKSNMLVTHYLPTDGAMGTV